MSGVTQAQLECLKNAIIRVSKDGNSVFDFVYLQNMEFNVDINFIKKYSDILPAGLINYTNVTIDDVLANPEIKWSYSLLSENRNFNLETILAHFDLGFNLTTYLYNPNASWQDIVNYPNLNWDIRLFLKGPIPNDYELLKKFDKLHLYIEYVDDVAKFLNDHKFNDFKLLEIVVSPKITIDVLEKTSELDWDLDTYVVYNPNATFDIITTNPLFKKSIDDGYYNYPTMSFEELLKTKNNNFPQYGNKVAFPFSAIKEHPEFFKYKFNYRNLDDYVTYSANKGLTWDVIVNNKHLPWSYSEYIKTHDDYDIDYIFQNMKYINDDDLYHICEFLINKLTQDQVSEIFDFLNEF